MEIQDRNEENTFWLINTCNTTLGFLISIAMFAEGWYMLELRVVDRNPKWIDPKPFRTGTSLLGPETCCKKTSLFASANKGAGFCFRTLGISMGYIGRASAGKPWVHQRRIVAYLPWDLSSPIFMSERTELLVGWGIFSVEAYIIMGIVLFHYGNL